MQTIAGFDALQGGLSRTFSGLSSPDPRTLVVRMGRPDCEFYKRTTHVVFSPVPAVAGAADNKTYNDMPIGDGPFKMAEPWQHDQRITLVRNDDFTASREGTSRPSRDFYSQQRECH